MAPDQPPGPGIAAAAVSAELALDYGPWSWCGVCGMPGRVVVDIRLGDEVLGSLDGCAVCLTGIYAAEPAS